MLFTNILKEMEYLFLVSSQVLDPNYRVGLDYNLISALSMNASKLTLNMAKFKRYSTGDNDRIYLVYDNSGNEFEAFSDKDKTIDVFVETLVISGEVKTVYVVNSEIFEINDSKSLERYAAAVAKATVIVLTSEFTRLNTPSFGDTLEILFDNALAVILMTVMDKVIEYCKESADIMSRALYSLGFDIIDSGSINELLRRNTVSILLDNSMMSIPLCVHRRIAVDHTIIDNVEATGDK